MLCMSERILTALGDDLNGFISREQKIYLKATPRSRATFLKYSRNKSHKMVCGQKRQTLC